MPILEPISRAVCDWAVAELTESTPTQWPTKINELWATLRTLRERDRESRHERRERHETRNFRHPLIDWLFSAIDYYLCSGCALPVLEPYQWSSRPHTHRIESLLDSIRDSVKEFTDSLLILSSDNYLDNSFSFIYYWLKCNSIALTLTCIDSDSE